MTSESNGSVRTAARLELATVAWNTIEAGVAIVSGFLAGSLALTGFGFDSGIEIVSAVLVLSRLRLAGSDEPNESRERRVLRTIGVTFYVLAAYLVVDGAHILFTTSRPDTSPAGLAISAAALVVMPLLAWSKRALGRRIGGSLGAIVLADAAETWLCALLALATLSGLLANALAGWWWADPVAGLIIAYFAIREGREAWRGELCED